MSIALSLTPRGCSTAAGILEPAPQFHGEAAGSHTGSAQRAVRRRRAVCDIAQPFNRASPHRVRRRAHSGYRPLEGAAGQFRQLASRSGSCRVFGYRAPMPRPGEQRGRVPQVATAPGPERVASLAGRAEPCTRCAPLQRYDAMLTPAAARSDRHATQYTYSHMSNAALYPSPSLHLSPSLCTIRLSINVLLLP